MLKGNYNINKNKNKNKNKNSQYANMKDYPAVNYLTTIAFAIMTLFLIFGSDNKAYGQSAGSFELTDSKILYQSLVYQGSPAKGDPNAPVTIVEFIDFQCPYCGMFVRETEPLIEQEYIDTGKVKMIFKHFPMIGEDSFTASLASQCANDQGKFWEFHSKVFENQGEENSGWASAENLKRFAKETGLNSIEFDKCLDTSKYYTFVKNELAFFVQLGVMSTPSFYVFKSNGEGFEEISGAFSFQTIASAIDKKIDYNG